MKPLSRAVLWTLAATVSLGVVPVSWGQVNQTLNGREVNGGTYYNTQGARTTFQNSGSGGLWVRRGALVRGVEVNGSTQATGNGGTLYFRAPDGMIRLEGDVDVSGVKNGNLYLGNGGKVFFDTPFLYQTGNIYANGVNGGLVQMNVGAATLGPNARITAMGFGGAGGKIAINSTGPVDIQQGALLDTSGNVVASFDTNLINIEGSAVNNAGVIRANGVAGADFKSARADAALLAANPQLLSKTIARDFSGSRGGTIRLIASGSPQNANPQGDVANFALLQANGAANKTGGTIIMAGKRSVTNEGLVQANGGTNASGGAVSMNTLGTIVNHGRIEASGGTQGTGGLVAFNYQAMFNTGRILANGGNGTSGGKGGLIVFSGADNPVGGGLVMANGGQGQQNGAAGTIVTPQPNFLHFTQSVSVRTGGTFSGPNSLAATQANELLVHNENLFLLTRGLGSVSESLNSRLLSAVRRSVANPQGFTANFQELIRPATNFVLASNSSPTLRLDLGSFPLNPMFENLNTMTLLNRGSVVNTDTWTPGVHIIGPGFHGLTFSKGGGHLSWISSGDIVNDTSGILLSRGLESGGSINLAAGRHLVNNGTMMNVAVNVHLLSAFTHDGSFSADHGGSTMLKAGQDVVNRGAINNNLVFYALHRQPLDLAWPAFLNQAQIGSSIRIQAGRDFINSGRISADALTYRYGDLGAIAPANAIGGVLTISANRDIRNSGYLSARGNSYFGSEPPRFSVLTATAAASTHGQVRLLDRSGSRSGVSFGNP
jgi:hypothetical protein